MLDVKFYESFEDEERLLKYYMPKDIRAEYAFQTIQETHSRVLLKNCCTVVS